MTKAKSQLLVNHKAKAYGIHEAKARPFKIYKGVPPLIVIGKQIPDSES